MFKKRGNFSNTFNSGADLIRSVEYVDSEHQETIFIGGYRGTDSVQIAFSTKNRDLLVDLIAKFRALNLEVSNLDSEFLIIDLGTIRISTENKESLSKFLDTIDEMNPIGKEVKKEIYDTLGLKQISDFDEFVEELKGMINESRLEEALEKALSVENEDILYVVGNYCESISRLEWAIQCYQLIPEGNLHYHESNYRSAHLIMEIKNSNDQSEEFSSFDMLEEKNDHSLLDEEKMVSYMLKAEENTDNQRFIDIVYHQLSGGDGFTPDVDDVRVNEETLFSIARKTKSLRHENAGLKEENHALLSRLAMLEKELMKAKKDKKSEVSGYSSRGMFGKISGNSSDDQGDLLENSKTNSL
jgi:hypothetical protein